MNIRAFKVVMLNGTTAFKTRSSDDGNSEGSSNIKGLADIVKSQIREASRVYDHELISIDLIPFHDFECPYGLHPRFCMPLSEQEKREFWEQFSKE